MGSEHFNRHSMINLNYAALEQRVLSNAAYPVVVIGAAHCYDEPVNVCSGFEAPKKRGISTAEVQRTVHNRNGFKARKEFWR